MIENVSAHTGTRAGHDAPGSFSLASAALISAHALSEHHYALTTLGYAVVPDALPLDFCGHLKRLLQQVIDAYVPASSERSVLDRYLMHDLLCRDPAFAALLEDPRLQQLLSPEW